MAADREDLQPLVNRGGVWVPAFGDAVRPDDRPPAPTPDELDAEECVHGIWPQSSCTMCNAKARAQEAEPDYRKITAKYDGQCHGCGLPISIGQEIAYRGAGYQVTHWECR